jgi:hypothetical protein
MQAAGSQDCGVTNEAAPRRWSTTVEGIRWLPRMIDKARMSANGTLGAYLLGHSPVDRALLRRLAITTAEFERLALAHASDAQVLAALRTRGFDEAAVRRWSDRFERQWAAYIRLWDLDEGYAVPRGIEVPLLALARKIESPLMALYRKIARAP